MHANWQLHCTNAHRKTEWIWIESINNNNKNEFSFKFFLFVWSYLFGSSIIFDCIKTHSRFTYKLQSVTTIYHETGRKHLLWPAHVRPIRVDRKKKSCDRQTSQSHAARWIWLFVRSLIWCVHWMDDVHSVEKRVFDLLTQVFHWITPNYDVRLVYAEIVNWTSKLHDAQCEWQ